MQKKKNVNQKVTIKFVSLEFKFIFLRPLSSVVMINLKICQINKLKERKVKAT